MSLRFEHQVFPESGTVVIRLVGRVSIRTLTSLRRELRALTHAGHRTIVVDLARAVVEDTSAVLPLVESARRARAQLAHIVVGNAPEQLAGRLRACGLGDRRRSPRSRGTG